MIPFYYTTWNHLLIAASTHNPLGSFSISEREITAPAREASTKPHLHAGGCQLGEVSPHLGNAVSQQPELLPGEAPGALPPHPPAVSRMLSRAPATPGTRTTEFFFLLLHFLRGLVMSDVISSLGM